MAKPMFFYTGIYDNVADADADDEAIKSLHRGKAIGSYDSAIVVHTPDGDVKVTKTEKPTQKGAWVGLAAGAGAAVVFPFLLPAVSYAGMAGAGAGLGAWFGHLAHGTSRGDAKDIGALLEPGKAALIVIGIDKDAEQIERALTRAEQHVLKRDVGDWDEAEQEALSAIERAEAAPVADAFGRRRRPQRLTETTMKPFTTARRLRVRGAGAVRLRLVLGRASPRRARPRHRHRRHRRTRQPATVCAARADIQAQVETLTTLSAGSATKADVTSALDGDHDGPAEDQGRAGRSDARAQAAGAGRGDGVRDAAAGHRRARPSPGWRRPTPRRRPRTPPRH